MGWDVLSRMCSGRFLVGQNRRSLAPLSDSVRPRDISFPSGPGAERRSPGRRHPGHFCSPSWELNGAIDTSVTLSMMLPTEVDVTVQIDEVQSVPDGFGFHLKA